jgi:hypothetical protein
MTRVYVPDIECESCVRLISKRLRDRNIKDFDIDDEAVTLHDPSKAEEVVRIIKHLGYRASTFPFERKTLKERLHDMKENPKKYALEFRGMYYAVWLFIVIEVAFLLAYIGFLKNIPDFFPKYGWWMLYLAISVTSLGIGLWHFHAYKGRVTCMTGMMIGMTFGMQTGMMIGAVVGATNGFFTGAMVGMLSAVVAGVVTGRSCGVMGWMQGYMSAIMGGTMGAMITVMMFADRVLVFMPFYMALNIIIMLGFSYMYYEEVVEKEEGVVKKPTDFITLAAICLIAAFVVGAIMLYGPKSALFV